MSQIAFTIGLAVMLPVLGAILARFIAIAIDAFKAGERGVGFALIGLMAAIIAAAMPWYLL